MKQISFLQLVFIFISSCDGQDRMHLNNYRDTVNKVKVSTVGSPGILYGPEPDPALQVSRYIRRMHEDRHGNLWFGTNGDGVCRYDGMALTYFTMKQGFGGSAVRGIVEDANGNLWFATDGGVSCYNESKRNNLCNKNACKHDLQIEQDSKEHNEELTGLFTNFTMKDGLCSNQLWCIFIDRSGSFWLGTENGVSVYNPSTSPEAGGKIFTKFSIPEADLTKFPNAYPSPKLINCIMQDGTGNIWFGANGGGAYCYDGKVLTNFSEKDGLCNNFVQCIMEDKQGNLWFGTRFGGLSRYNPRLNDNPAQNKTFTNFDFDFKVREGLSKNFIWTLLEDKRVSVNEHKMWIGTAGGGLYCEDGKSFINFSDTEGLPNKFIQSLLIDKKGNFWVGSSGGLFRYNESQAKFINVTRKGPWQ